MAPPRQHSSRPNLRLSALLVPVVPTTQQQHGSRGEESSSGAKTLGQMRDECMAWANADD